MRSLFTQQVCKNMQIRSWIYSMIKGSVRADFSENTARSTKACMSKIYQSLAEISEMY